MLGAAAMRLARGRRAAGAATRLLSGAGGGTPASWAGGPKASAEEMERVAKQAFVTPAERSKLCKALGVKEERVLLTLRELRAWRAGLQGAQGYAGETVGFVPTMGALHAGHLSLLAASKRENKHTVASIFVNPAQFAPHEDFSKYPRQAHKDLEMMFAAGCDRVFLPHQSEMYPGSAFGQTSRSVSKTHVVPDDIDSVSEGAARPGFFRGVSTVVCKLLNLVQPTHLYLGQKDGLQCIVVRRMVRDLNIPSIVRPCPTLREPDGLAMSSRNIYLRPEQRKAAPALFQALQAVEAAFNTGERDYSKLRAAGLKILDAEKLWTVQYLSLCDAVDGGELNTGAPLGHGDIMCSAAVNFGNCRILDNVLLGRQS
jgi:pantoate--beta-alanine ligase